MNHIFRFICTATEKESLVNSLMDHAFIGSLPNTKMIANLKLSVRKSLIGYASVINAFSKYTSFEKENITKCIYNILENFLDNINTTNQQQVVDESLTLCASLSNLMLWLLLNIEYFINNNNSFMTKFACKLVLKLTSQPKTVSMLKIARYEETSFWNKIDNTLLQIKNKPSNNVFITQINAVFKSVANLSRKEVQKRPSYTGITSSTTFCPPVVLLIVSEIEANKLSDVKVLGEQLISAGKMCGISLSDLFYNIISTSLLSIKNCKNLPDSLNSWFCMLFVYVPKLFEGLKQLVTENLTNSQKVTEYKHDLFLAINLVIEHGSMLDAVDHLIPELSVVEILTASFKKHQLLDDEILNQLSQSRAVKKCILSSDLVQSNFCEVKKEDLEDIWNFSDKLVEVLNNIKKDMNQQFNYLKNTFNVQNLSMIISSAVGEKQNNLLKCLSEFNSLMNCASPDSNETQQDALVRASLFDFSFLFVVQLVDMYGEEALFSNSLLFSQTFSNYLQTWLKKWWPVKRVIEEILPSVGPNQKKVESLIYILRGQSDMTIMSQKWTEVTDNLPQAFIELLRAYQSGIFDENELVNACNLISQQFPFCSILTIVCSLSRVPHLIQYKVYTKAIKLLLVAAEDTSVRLPLHELRLKLFSKLASKFSKITVSSNDSFLNTSEFFNKNFNESLEKGLVTPILLSNFKKCLAVMGVPLFVETVCDQVLNKHPSLQHIKEATDIAFTLLLIQPETASVYLLKVYIMRLIKMEPNKLLEPTANCFISLIVSTIEVALTNARNKYKLSQSSNSIHSRTEKTDLNPFLFDQSSSAPNENRLRRMLSCSTEHDLNSNNSNELSPSDPIVSVLLSFFKQVQSHFNILPAKKVGPQYEFVYSFIKLCLTSSEILSQTVKEIMTLEFFSLLSSRLASEDFELLFLACDLNKSNFRKVAADSVLFSFKYNKD